MTAARSGAAGSPRLFPLTLTAIGVVYGDIGTSPLYTIRECFYGPHGFAPTQENVLGVLSLVVYSLVLIISIKYIAIVMRADNQGEGGILALTSLIPSRTVVAGAAPVLVLLGVFGASMLYGEAIITPAISVLSAVEGLQAETPLFEPYVVPIAVVILVVLFVFQQFGTHRVGGLFGPIMLVWFVTIGVLGIVWIVRAPVVLTALNPLHAVTFFRVHGGPGVLVLGAVVLAVTGAEALYVDMGHFGKRPIRLAWFTIVFPALVLNYFGQGALLLIDGAAARQPFFLLVPAWGLLPLVAIATAAAIIASQALISGAFSLTQQAIQLGYAPRLDIEHTSSSAMGQVYVPQVNWALMIATIVIVIGFESSSALAAAYGIAVTMTMVITTILLCVVAPERWHWATPLVFGGAAIFLPVDLTLFGAYGQLTCDGLGQGVWTMRAVYGFMEGPNVPDALRSAQNRGVEIDADDVTYFLGRETILVTHRRGMAMWREKLFVLMTRNAVRATAFFRLPPERVVELGVQVEI